MENNNYTNNMTFTKLPNGAYDIKLNNSPNAAEKSSKTEAAINELGIKYEDLIRLLKNEAADRESFCECKRYLNYICDDENKPFIFSNMLIRAETRKDALEFAKFMVSAESVIKGKIINSSVRDERSIKNLDIKKINKLNETMVVIIDSLMSVSEIEEEKRKKGKNIFDVWQHIIRGLESAKNKNFRFIVCADYNEAEKRFDQFGDKAVVDMLKGFLTFDVKDKRKGVIEVSHLLMSKLKKGNVEVDKEFRKDIIKYNLAAYNEAEKKGMDYIDDIYSKLIKSIYTADEKTRPDISVLLKPTPKVSAKTALEKLNGLTGLSNVKNMIKELEGYCRMNPAEAKDMSLNFVFTGNPGTGKTTVARLMAQMFCSMGIIKTSNVVEVLAGQLIGRYVGDDTRLTLEACEKAYGGILFIDEAHDLNPESAANNLKASRQAALSALIKEMEDNRDKLTVIMAGYGEEMKELLEKNPGLRSRIYKVVEFEDFTVDELADIFKADCEESGYSYSDSAIEKAKDKLGILRFEENFGNARSVRNVFREAQLSAMDGDKVRKDIRPEDIIIENPLPDYKMCSSRLNELVGLANVKKRISEIVALCKYNKTTGNNAVPSVSNMVFTGNPGTGKSTVAGLIGNMLFNVGAVKAPRFVSINAYEISSSKVGGVAENLRKYCRSAMGGVLFIDEAYALSEFRGGGDSEAVSVLLDMMENYRDDLVVILAGYKDKMKMFFESNPGLRSRIPSAIDFDDYTKEELEEIFVNMCESNGFSVSQEALNNFSEVIDASMRFDDFANARTVRNIFEGAYRCHAVRCTEDDGISDDQMISGEDLRVEDYNDDNYIPLGFY